MVRRISLRKDVVDTPCRSHRAANAKACLGLPEAQSPAKACGWLTWANKLSHKPADASGDERVEPLSPHEKSSAIVVATLSPSDRRWNWLYFSLVGFSL